MTTTRQPDPEKVKHGDAKLPAPATMGPDPARVVKAQATAPVVPVKPGTLARDKDGKPINPVVAGQTVRLAEVPPPGDDGVVREVLRGVGMLTEPASLQAVVDAASGALKRKAVPAPAAPGHLV